MSTTLERIEFMGQVAEDARQAITAYLVSRVDDDDWAAAIEYSISAVRHARLARARVLAGLEASQHVSDGGQERGAGEVEPVERQVDVP